MAGLGNRRMAGFLLKKRSSADGLVGGRPIPGETWSACGEDRRATGGKEQGFLCHRRGKSHLSKDTQIEGGYSGCLENPCHFKNLLFSVDFPSFLTIESWVSQFTHSEGPSPLSYLPTLTRHKGEREPLPSPLPPPPTVGESSWEWGLSDREHRHVDTTFTPAKPRTVTTTARCLPVFSLFKRDLEFSFYSLTAVISLLLQLLLKFDSGILPKIVQ